ncbi:type II toxin-antitoxin system VapC family toxin [Olivibacter domesticus]|uniref:PIN domain nuclease, a component of toxin-antitoxin system (PIN domain) n=1 Tax=Olivibacter domesticus TaxID=407022 RepID=A0A1H7SIE2_OLID1|nr:type II toxin-antitoxin system VapC family toxin [Olivibacter domesticus]SEL71217.1 PIN domain nuclease, a component of toxin-antitoxin system (PIN domain) [Olivibacter domesticus]
MQHNLLDTHTFIWFVNGDNQLSSKAKKSIENERTVNYISVASLWEIAIKISLQKLELGRPFAQIENIISSNGFQLLPISFDDTIKISTLPFHHRDPFDRIILCQSMTKNLQIISKDKNFKLYNISLLW